MATNKEARFKRLAQESRRRERATRQQLDQLTAAVEQLPDPDAMGERLRTLNERLHRAAWEKAAADAGVSPDRLDDLWKLAPPEISDDEPDPKALAKHVKASVKGREAFLVPAETDDEDDSSGDEEAEEPEVKDIFDLARPGAPAKAEPGDDKPAPAKGGKPAAPKPEAGKPAPKLGKGEGSGRGGRDDHKAETLSSIVDRDFAATGREDAFKL